MNLKYYFLMFILYSFLGWLGEVLATYDRKKGFVNRGFLIGPCCPIYGISSISMILLLNTYHNVLLLFLMSIIICSILEYITSYLMEKLFNARWWDYTGRFLNINGRICFENSLIFGILGVILIKSINPFVNIQLQSFPKIIIDYSFYAVLLLFLLDSILSFNVIYKIKKTAKFIRMDNTREITEKVKEILNKTLQGKRIINAFPNIDFMIKDIEKKIRGKK